MDKTTNMIQGKAMNGARFEKWRSRQARKFGAKICKLLCDKQTAQQGMQQHSSKSLAVVVPILLTLLLILGIVVFCIGFLPRKVWHTCASHHKTFSFKMLLFNHQVSLPGYGTINDLPMEFDVI
jgi:hypothetical protein